jgi:hypothetical protein
VLQEEADWCVTFHPIAPAVVTAYRCHYWDDIMEHVRLHERFLLHVCTLPETVPNIQGRLLEAIVLQKIVSKGLDFIFGESTICIDSGRVEHFPGSLLPMHSQIHLDTLYVPDCVEFPVFDFFSCTGNVTCAFQVRRTKYDKNVGPRFLKMCQEAGWLRNNAIVILIYLSPTEQSPDYIGRHVQDGRLEQGPMTLSSNEEITGQIYVGSRCFADFPGSLATISYPPNRP